MNNFRMTDIPQNGHIHFVGIGGISMSGIAEILLKKGYKISGSDLNDTHITRNLTKMGATVYNGHNAENVIGADLVVYTAAVKYDNPELVEARKRNIMNIERATLLGGLMYDYDYSICVAGTHGKTTTTSMMSLILLEADKNPTIMLGGELDAIGGNFRYGGEHCFLTEACEYHRSFLQFFPNVAVITNVDADHLDYFSGIDEIKDTFGEFAQIPGEDGYVVVCGDDANAMYSASKTDAQILTYGIGEDNIFTAENLVYNAGYGEFDVEYDGKIIHVSLNVCGTHNVLNALACFAVGYAIGLDGETIRTGLEAFECVHRRFERLGSVNGATIIDDYAHHPTEIKCTLKTAATVADGRVVVVFQPHTYTRTKLLLDEFSQAFENADEIIVTDIYAAREKDTGLIHARDLAEKIAATGKDAKYISSFDDIADYLKKDLKKGDIGITMGAGTVYKIAEKLI